MCLTIKKKVTDTSKLHLTQTAWPWSGTGRTGRQDDLPLRLHLVLLSTRHKLDRLGNPRRLLALGLGLEQYLGGLRAGEHDEVFPVGIRLEVSRERRGPSSRLWVDRSGGVKKPVASPVS